MQYIATAALVAFVWIGSGVWRALCEIREELRNPPISNTNMVLNPQIVDLLTNFRRRRVKKEVA